MGLIHMLLLIIFTKRGYHHHVLKMVKLLLMKPSLQKLQKFLKLEADRGYDNHAVLGGLERMLAPWEAEARVDQIPEDFIQAVVSRLHDYQRLSPKSRAEALQGLWRRIQREANINLPPLPAAYP